MKTLVANDTGISLYLWPDDYAVTLYADRTELGDPVTSIVADCNQNNCVLHEQIDAPQDWKPWRYYYDGTDWVVNPNYVEVD